MWTAIFAAQTSSVPFPMGIREVYPEAAEQRCWNHRIINLLDRIVRKDQPPAKELLRAIVYADTVQQAEREKATFQRWCRTHGYDDAAELIPPT